MTAPQNLTDRDLIAEVVSRCQLGTQFLLDLERALEVADVPIYTDGEPPVWELERC